MAEESLKYGLSMTRAQVSTGNWCLHLKVYVFISCCLHHVHKVSYLMPFKVCVNRVSRTVYGFDCKDVIEQSVKRRWIKPFVLWTGLFELKVQPTTWSNTVFISAFKWSKQVTEYLWNYITKNRRTDQHFTHVVHLYPHLACVCLPLLWDFDAKPFFFLRNHFHLSVLKPNFRP